MAATTTEYGKPMILYSDKASVFRVNNKHATTGLGDTQFARAMRCLNITPLCAETSQAKGRVERAHLTLQDRLVKELRLKGICTIEAANAFAEEYMADYNRRFAKEPLHDFNAYRPLALDDDLDAEFTWREPRRVSKNLTVQYDKMLYLIEDNEYSRRAIGKYIDVWHYPDGHKELRLNGVLLPYSTYDRLSDFGWIYDALSSNTPEISVNPKLVRALLARTYTFASQSLVKQELPYDFEMLKNIAEQDNVLAKLYGIAELNNGQALNASYPYTISELAKLLDMGSWHYVHKVLERIHKETGFNIKSSDNNYHVLVKTGKEGVHKYSPAAFELIKKIINGQKYKLKP